MTSLATMASYGRQTLSRLRHDRSGATIVDFALTLPIFIGIAVTGIEVANYVSLHTRISQIALMAADNGGRVRTSIDESDVEEVMVGVRTAGSRIDFGTKGRVILSSLQPNGMGGSDAGQWIRWQRCFGAKNVVSRYGLENDGATDASRATGMGSTTNKITAASGAVVMFVEVFYDFEPLVANTFIPNKTLHYTAAYTVRERTASYPTNLTNMANSNKRLCSRYSST